jgi:ABC-type Mn2+/Zn2+ transport system permease subunit
MGWSDYPLMFAIGRNSATVFVILARSMKSTTFDRFMAAISAIRHGHIDYAVNTTGYQHANHEADRWWDSY